MKIDKPGEYKTRDGRKAVVFGIAPDGFYNIAGYVGGGYGVLVWSESGICSTCATLNLISEWEEPAPEKSWADILLPAPTGTTTDVYLTRHQARYILDFIEIAIAARIAKLEEQ